MTKEMSKRIGEVVDANKDYMSIEDMAEEFNLEATKIRSYCTLHCIKVISPKNVLINYMHDMKGRKTLEQIAEASNYNVSYLHILLKSLGEDASDYKVSPKIKKSFTQLRMDAALRENVIERLEGHNTEPHFKDKYTQSGTPFGLADQLRGIKLGS